MDKQAMLELFDTIRKNLHDNGINELGLEFPIVEMKAVGDVVLDSRYLGYCHSTYGDWDLVGDCLQVAKLHGVSSVEICLADPATNEPYTIERTVPTLLHEFAHCITPGIMVKRYGHDSETGKPKRKWSYDSHGDRFYESFSKILEAAEQLGIYKLPSSFSKYNFQSLRRFDAVDVDGKNVFVGQVNFKDAPKVDKNSGQQKIVVVNDKGEQKLIITKGQKDIFLELKEACVQKFQIKNKKKVKFITQQGDTIEDSGGIFGVLQKQGVIMIKIS